MEHEYLTIILYDHHTVFVRHKVTYTEREI